MDLRTFLREIDGQAAAVITPEFAVNVVRTDRVPTLDDPALTFDDHVGGAKSAKQIETCVLYIDIRDSSRISAERRPQTLARMYSAFVAAMLDCIRREGGHVRNIIGDRVMAVFDSPGCFVAAARTAALCNTVAQLVLAPRLAALREGLEFRCGIGIDYGTMLVTKAGRARRAGEREFYRSLVWLGRPANVASKLTDAAHKRTTLATPGVSVLRMRGLGPSPLGMLLGSTVPQINPAPAPALRPSALSALLRATVPQVNPPPPPAQTPGLFGMLLAGTAPQIGPTAPLFPAPGAPEFVWTDESFDQFLGQCETASLASGERVLRHRDPSFRSFLVNLAREITRETPAVLITQAVYDGLREALGDEGLRRHGWTAQALKVAGHTDRVYGTNLVFVLD